jgi:hypothetical protein
MDSDLGRLYFGRDDAEMDSAEGGLLHAGFLRTSAYDAVRRARKHLIIGRKGSGKSAICRMLAADTDPSFATVLVTPDELSADELQRFELQGIPPEMAKGLLWRYLLTTEVAKHLVTHARTAHHKHVPASVDALHRFLVANGELEETRTKFWQIIQKLKTSLSLDAFGVKVSMEIGGGPSEGIRTNDMLDVIDRNVTRAIADLDCQKNHPRSEERIEPADDTFSIHPCFRYALRAESPTPAEPFSTEPFGEYLVSQGGGDGGSGGAGAYLSRLARGTVETRLLQSTYRYVDELRVTLHDSGLPAEILTDLWSSVDRIMRNLSAMRTDRSPDMADVVRHTLEVAEFLGNTSNTLEQSGFANSDKARSFVRRIGEAGQRLRREAAGTERS